MDDFDLDEVPVVDLGSPRRRSTTRLLAGVGLLALSAMVGAYLFVASSPETTRVMVADGELAAGESVGAGNFRVVEVGSVGGLDVVTPDEQEVLFGLVPRSPIPGGTVLNRGMFVSPDEAIPPGKVVVGALLGPGSAPLERLRVGDRVGLVAVVSNPGLSDGGPELLGDGEVWAIGSSDGGQGDELWVSVLVDLEMQVAVAQAASVDELWVTAVRP